MSGGTSREADDHFVRRGSRVALATAGAFVATAGLVWLLANVACASGGLECVVWAIPMQILLAAGAPTAAIFVPPVIDTAPWLGLLLGVGTSLPGWWWIGGALARKALKRRPESAWRTWQGYLVGTMVGSVAAAGAVGFVLFSLLVPPG